MLFRSSAARRRLGISSFGSAGNRADVSGNDLLQYWQDDEQTEVVLLYLESLGNPRKFTRVARRLSRSKPVVAMRSGGVPEVIRDGVCGLLVAPGETRQLADAISRLLADRRFASEMGQNGWRRANRYYDIRRVAREVQEVYEEILGR